MLFHPPRCLSKLLNIEFQSYLDNFFGLIRMPKYLTRNDTSLHNRISRKIEDARLLLLRWTIELLWKLIVSPTYASKQQRIHLITIAYLISQFLKMSVSSVYCKFVNDMVAGPGNLIISPTYSAFLIKDLAHLLPIQTRVGREGLHVLDPFYIIFLFRNSH